MKILVISQRYWPENFRINSITKALVEMGNDVTVLTGLPMYPKGYVEKEYKNKENWNQIHDGVKIIRVKEFERKNNSIFNRFLNYYSFPFFANKKIKKLESDFDVVLINELSPIMCSIPAIKYAKKHCKKIVMYEMDLWPESLLAGGIKKDSFIYNFYKKVAGKIYSRCDKVLVSTNEHIEYIKQLPKCGSLDVEYLPQFAEEEFEKLPEKSSKRDEYFNLVFAGNIGKAQSVETIIKAAELLRKKKRYRFHILGNGSNFSQIKKLVEQLKLKNVIVYGNKPLEDMPKYYAMADAMLITLENKAYANMTIPGKLQSYVAAGKPVIGAISGATQNLIRSYKIGECCDAEDYVKLAEIIKNVDSKKLSEYANNAKILYKNEFSKQLFMGKLVDAFKGNVIPSDELVIKSNYIDEFICFKNGVNFIENNGVSNILLKELTSDSELYGFALIKNNSQISDRIQIKTKLKNDTTIFSEFNKQELSNEKIEEILSKIKELKDTESKVECELNESIKKILDLISGYAPIYVTLYFNDNMLFDKEELRSINCEFPLIAFSKEKKPVKVEKENAKENHLPLYNTDYLFASLFSLFGMFSIYTGFSLILSEKYLGIFLVILSAVYLVFLYYCISKILCNGLNERSNRLKLLLLSYISIGFLTGCGAGFLISSFLFKISAEKCLTYLAIFAPTFFVLLCLSIVLSKAVNILLFKIKK